MKKLMAISAACAVLAGCASVCCVGGSPKIDASNDRVKIKPENVKYAKLGVLIPKDVSQTKNNITIGGETLDRDYADYDAYKEYLAPLGLKKIRLQGGWAKTEKVKGVYNFGWLDHIVNDAIARGLKPWLQLSYGNPIYEGGGTPFLKGGMPYSPEAKAAWDKWVAEMAKRYAGKVEWEIWNEPDLNKEIPRHATITLNIRTADIIRKHDPNGKIAALALCDISPKRFELYISDLAKKGMLGEFDWISYHGYTYSPEDAYYKDPQTCVDKMIQVLAKYRKGAKPVLRQGENGCPSKGGLGGALTGHPWTECTQAKWDLRRMLGDWGRGIETSVFSISDMHYAPTDSIKIVNVKGLLATDENNQVVKIKTAYYAVQNLAAVFDLLDIHSGKLQPSAEYPEQIEAFGYVDLDTGLPAFTLWFGDSVPTNNNMNIPVDIALKGGAKIENPVWVDILSGGVYEIPEADVSRKGADLLIKAMPLYDSPILITDKSLVDFRK